MPPRCAAARRRRLAGLPLWTVTGYLWWRWQHLLAAATAVPVAAAAAVATEAVVMLVRIAARLHSWRSGELSVHVVMVAAFRSEFALTDGDGIPVVAMAAYVGGGDGGACGGGGDGGGGDAYGSRNAAPFVGRRGAAGEPPLRRRARTCRFPVSVPCVGSTLFGGNLRWSWRPAVLRGDSVAHCGQSGRQRAESPTFSVDHLSIGL